MKLPLIAIFIVTKTILTVQSGLTEIATRIERPLDGTCVQKIIKENLPCGSVITLINLKRDANLLMQLLNKEACYTVTTRNFGNLNSHTTKIPTNMYIIGLNDLDSMDKVLACFTGDMFRKPNTKIIFGFAERLLYKSLKSFFTELMRHNIFNAILVNIFENDSAIYSYDPFANGGCGRNAENILHMGACERNNTDEEYFYNVTIDVLKNCPLVVAAGHDVPNFIFESKNYTRDGKPILGIEQYLIEIIAEKENLTVEYQLATNGERFGVVLPNGTYTGILRSLQRGTADIAAGGFGIMMNRVEVLDLVWGFQYSAYELFTHVDVAPRWKYLYREFSLKTWSLVVIAFTAVVLITLYSMRVAPKVLLANARISLIIRLWGYIFANTSGELNKGKTLRCILIFWIWFTFFVSNFYSTALYSLITRQVGRRNSAKRIDSLIENGYEACISESDREFFKYAYNYSFPSGLSNTRCELTGETFDSVALDPTKYTIGLDYNFAIHECKYLTEEGAPLLEHSVFTDVSLNVMYFHRGSLIMPTIQKYINHIFEAGLISKQQSEIYRDSQLNCQLKVRVFHKFNMRDLRVAFILLVLGCLIAIVTFLFEVNGNRLKNVSEVSEGHKD